MGDIIGSRSVKSDVVSQNVLGMSCFGLVTGSNFLKKNSCDTLMRKSLLKMTNLDF